MRATAKAILDRQFVEVLIAPEFDAAALAYAKKKANVRVLRIPHGEGRNNADVKRVGSGLLMQTSDIREVTRDELKVVTKRAPTPQELDDLLFAWRVAKYVKSNAIVYARDSRTIGIGAGPDEPRGVGEDRRAQGRGSRPDGAGLGDGLAMRSSRSATASMPRPPAGIRTVIQPGGSMRDSEVIAAADEHDIAMVFTGIRHFRH